MKSARSSLVPSLLALVFLSAPSASGRASQDPTLADLAWLAGHWSVELGPTRIEEVWLAPAGGFLLGMNRTAPKNGKGSFEYLRIEQRKDGIVYVASPGGRAPTDFPLADFGKDFALFANPAHDFPKEIRYELTKDGDLHARVSGEAGGKEQAEEWTWKRQ
jgi:hypothetical protein